MTVSECSIFLFTYKFSKGERIVFLQLSGIGSVSLICLTVISLSVVWNGQYNVVVCHNFIVKVTMSKLLNVLPKEAWMHTARSSYCNMLPQLRLIVCILAQHVKHISNPKLPKITFPFDLGFPSLIVDLWHQRTTLRLKYLLNPRFRLFPRFRLSVISLNLWPLNPTLCRAVRCFCCTRGHYCHRVATLRKSSQKLEPEWKHLVWCQD